MEIACPTCNMVYNIPSHKIPKGRKVSTKCKKCGGKIVVEARVEKARPAAPKTELVVSKEATASVIKDKLPISPQLSQKKSPQLVSTSLREAKKHIRNGWIAASISATITLILSLISLTGSSIAGFNLLNLLDVAFIAGLGYGIYKESRACAVIMFTYFLISKISSGIQIGKPSSIFISVIFLYLYFQAVRGTFAIKNIQQMDEASQPPY